jgi:signal transduction histidine kinase
MELGADDYLTKPFTRSELLAAIRARLSRHSALMEAHQQQLDQAKTTLTHLVTHELRTPLISIMMIQDIIGRRLGQLSEAQLRDLLDTLATGTKRLVHVVEQMVYITELESGTLSTAAVADRGKAVELWQIITTSIDLGRRFAYRNQDGTILTQQRDRDMMVVANISSLKHALAELISNALAFSPEGSTVTIVQWKADGSAWISIVDQGSGISSEQVSQVFNEFYQVDRAKREQQGIGLGLSVAKRIIEAHGGSLSLSSVSDKGTQVVVSLPAAQP